MNRIAWIFAIIALFLTMSGVAMSASLKPVSDKTAKGDLAECLLLGGFRVNTPTFRGCCIEQPSDLSYRCTVCAKDGSGCKRFTDAARSKVQILRKLRSAAPSSGAVTRKSSGGTRQSPALAR